LHRAGSTGPDEVFSSSKAQCWAVALSTDGRWLASANEGALEVRDLSRRPVSAVPLNADIPPVKPSRVYGLAFAPHGRLLASAHADGAVQLWAQKDGQWRPRTVLGHHEKAPARTVVFSSDGQTLASSGEDGAVQLWDVESRRGTAFLPGDLSGPSECLLGLAVTPDGKTLFPGGQKSELRRWDLRANPPRLVGGAFPAALGGSAAGVLAVSPDGKTLAVVVGATIHLWDLVGDEPQHKEGLRGHTDAITALAFRPYQGRPIL